MGRWCVPAVEPADGKLEKRLPENEGGGAMPARAESLTVEWL